MSYPNTKRYATLERTIMLRSQLRFLINAKGLGRCYFSQQNIELFLLQSSWDLLSGLRHGNYKTLKPSGLHSLGRRHIHRDRYTQDKKAAKVHA